MVNLRVIKIIQPLCILYLFFLWLLLMSPCSTCLHIPPPPRTVMLILIFNSTAYCHAHSLILYILYSVLYILFFIHFILCILPLLYSTIFALSMERTWFTFHCWLYNLFIVVYVTNKTWNLTCKTFCFREQFNENISTKASEKYYRRIINIHLSDSENVKLIKNEKLALTIHVQNCTEFSFFLGGVNCPFK